LIVVGTVGSVGIVVVAVEKDKNRFDYGTTSPIVAVVGTAAVGTAAVGTAAVGTAAGGDSDADDSAAENDVLLLNTFVGVAKLVA
jgi:hypothetical protein